MTSHYAAVSYPVFLDRRTLLYLAGDADGSGPWLHSMDVERRVAHRLTARLDRFTSLAVAADGHRLAATLASAKTSLWRLHIGGASPAPSSAVLIPITTGDVSQPRLTRDSLLYVVATGTGESLWKSVNGVSSEIWSADDIQIFGAPAISPDQRWIAFSASRHGQKLLYLMQADGANARVVTASLNLQGAPAWGPDGRSITTAVEDHGIPRLYQVPLDGRAATPLVSEYSINPAWSPDGRFVVYTGADIGTTFAVRAVTAGSVAHPMPAVQLSRGARHLVFLPGSDSLVVLRGEMQHKDLWLVDLKTGAERQLTHLRQSSTQSISISRPTAMMLFSNERSRLLIW